MQVSLINEVRAVDYRDHPPQCLKPEWNNAQLKNIESRYFRHRTTTMYWGWDINGLLAVNLENKNYHESIHHHVAPLSLSLSLSLSWVPRLSRMHRVYRNGHGHELPDHDHFYKCIQNPSERYANTIKSNQIRLNRTSLSITHNQHRQRIPAIIHMVLSYNYLVPWHASVLRPLLSLSLVSSLFSLSISPSVYTSSHATAERRSQPLRRHAEHKLLTAARPVSKTHPLTATPRDTARPTASFRREQRETFIFRPHNAGTLDSAPLSTP